MSFSFNRRQYFSDYEVALITKLLFPLMLTLEEEEEICIINGLHYSRGDVLPHFTYEIWNRYKFNDVKTIQRHAYVWDGNEIVFTTQFIKTNEMIVF